MFSKPIVIAEIGCNHKGKMDIAYELIKTAKECGADIAKFQKRHNKELLTEEQYNAPHPNPRNSYGDTYGEHREFLEFSVDQHKELQAYCNEIGIEYSTSVWDTTSAQEITSLKPSFVKVPSACNNHTDMLLTLINNFSGDIHVSLGMTSKEEEAELIELFRQHKALGRLVIYHCTSGYPVAFEDLNLLEISTLRDKYEKEAKGIGFSGHHLGIAVDVAAYTLGATYIERHFTLDRTWKGTDHAASLEPTGLRKLCRDLKATHNSLQYQKGDFVEVEIEQRNKLKYRPR
jgi:N-acetylneuraminate synthase